MMNQQTHKISISTLYQLSLSISHSRSLKDNCKSFLKRFIEIEAIEFAAIVEKSLKEEVCYQLLASTSRYEVNQALIHWEGLPEKPHFYIGKDNDIFDNIKHQANINSGIYVFVRLGERAFLKCYIPNGTPFSQENWEVLQPVLNNLEAAITAAYQKEVLKQKNEALKTRIELYDIAIHNASEGMMLNDENGHIMFVNQKFCKMMGYERTELIGQVCYKVIFAEEEWSDIEAQMKLVDKRAIVECKERKLVHKNGETWWGLVSMSPLISKNEDFHGIFVTALDISDKKKSEIERETLIKALTKSEDKYRSVVQSLSEGVIMTDKLDRITYVNEQMCVLAGYSEMEMLGRKAYELLLPEEEWNPSQDKLVDRSKGVSESYVKRHIKKDGTSWWGNINASPLIGDSGEFIGTLAAVMDVTKQKNAEQQREQLLNELAEKNKDLDEFAYIVSHDLKAPLRAIKTLSDWIYEDYADVLDEEGQNQIRLLRKRALRMHTFIESMLEYTRIGSTKIKRERFDLNEAVLQIIDSFQPLDNFEIKILTALPIIEAEKIRIEQVFQNLISNSIKYNDKPKGLIEISHESNENYNIFRVCDNGVGIEKKYFDKIFQIFQTLQTRDSYESTGVGLTIVKKIVETHQGKIMLESEYGKGTTFIFTIKK